MAADSRAAACDLEHGMFPPLQTLVADGVREARRSQDVRGFLLPESGKPTLSRAAATASLTFSRDEAIDDATQQGRRHSTAGLRKDWEAVTAGLPCLQLRRGRRPRPKARAATRPLKRLLHGWSLHLQGMREPNY